jgi:hypothetical protein
MQVYNLALKWNVARGWLAIWHIWQMPKGLVLKWAGRVFVKRLRII